MEPSAKYNLAPLLCLVAVTLLSGCKPPSESKPVVPVGNTPSAGIDSQPQNAGGAEPALPAAQGTADGSGGDGVKSKHSDIDAVIFDAENPDQSLKRLLQLTFHRLKWRWEHRSPHQEPDSLYATWEQIFSDKHAEDIQQSIFDMEFVAQEEPCRSSDNRHTDMAIDGNKVCVSRQKLSRYSPEDLPLQMLAVAAHEVAHLRGIRAEKSADEVRDFVAKLGRSIIAPVNNVSFFLESLGGILNSDDFDPSVSLDDRRVGDCSQLGYSLQMHEQYYEAKHEHYVTIPYGNLGYRGYRKLLEHYCYRRNTDISATDVLDEVISRMDRIHQKQLDMEQTHSPFRSNRPSWSFVAGRAKLLYNATRPSLTEQGVWTESNTENSTPKIQCTFDGEPLLFDSDFCLSNEAMVKQNKSPGVVGPEIHNNYSGNQRSCARVKTQSMNGAEPEFILLAGPHDFYYPAATEFVLYDVVGLQILLNYENHDFKKTKPETFKIFALDGEGIMTDRNNVQSFQRSKFAGDAYAILHPKNAKSLNVNLHLPSAFNEVKNMVEYEAKPHSLECVVE